MTSAFAKIICSCIYMKPGKAALSNVSTLDCVLENGRFQWKSAYFCLTVIGHWHATRWNSASFTWGLIWRMEGLGPELFLGRGNQLELSALGSQASTPALGSPFYWPRNDLALNLLQSHIWLLRLETGQNTRRKFQSYNKSNLFFLKIVC